MEKELKSNQRCVDASSYFREQEFNSIFKPQI